MSEKNNEFKKNPSTTDGMQVESTSAPEKMDLTTLEQEKKPVQPSTLFQGEEIPDLSSNEKVIKFMESSAIKGSETAQLWLGGYYGQLLKYGYHSKSIHYYQLAANQGSQRAILALGRTLSTTKESIENISHLISAAEMGSKEAAKKLGWLYSSEVDGVPADSKKSLEYYHLAASLGDEGSNEIISSTEKIIEIQMSDVTRLSTWFEDPSKRR